jgi:hypothetical protein
MPKRITPDHPIYVAHEMLGMVEGGLQIVKDELKPGSSALNPTEFNNKIKIYERQVNGWFLYPARYLFNSMGFQAGFVIITVCFSYLEGVEQYRQGLSSKGRSAQLFYDSFKRVFGENTLDDIALKTLYEQGRCGLFHDGMTRSDVIANMELKEPIAKVHNGDADLIHFNPEQCLVSVEKDFDGYINELKDSPEADLAKNFDKMYNIVSSLNEKS